MTREILATHVAKLIKIKNEIQSHQQRGKELRLLLKTEEEQIEGLMKDLQIGECTTANICLKLAPYKKVPTASFKTILPIIEQVFNATPEEMEMFLQTVKDFKARNGTEQTRILYRKKVSKTDAITTNVAVPSVNSHSPSNPHSYIQSQMHHPQVISAQMPNSSLASALATL